MAQDYYCILTNAGLAYEAACKANQVPIKLTHFAVGDGNGAAYNPGPEATALRRETHRQAINSLLQDEANPSWLMAEAMIADDVGGWTIREVGIYTDTGLLYAIGKYPDSVKPILAQGSGKQFYVRAIFQTSNATSVTLLIDNSIVMATRAFVLEHVQAELAKRDAKNSVLYTTTAAIALSGLGVQAGGDWPSALPAGARILPRHQPDAKDNGIYIAAAGAWTRATDADASLEVTPGLLIPVEQGTVHADSLWQMVTDGPITLGVTALQFEMAAGRTGVAGGTYDQVTVNARGQVVGATRTAVSSIAADTTLTVASRGLVLIDAAAGNRTITLPLADTGLGVMDILLRRVDNSGNRLKVQASGANKIKFHTHLNAAGYAFLYLMGAGDWWHLRSDGAGNWWPVGRHDSDALGRPVFETTTAFQPGGWGALAGSILDRADWPWLWDHAQVSGMLVPEGSRVGMEGGWTTGNGTTWFRGPEGRGEFLRLLDDGRGVDRFDVKGTLTSGSAVISAVTFSAGNSIAIGQTLSAVGIPAGATVTAFTANSITMSVNATASSAAGTITVAGRVAGSSAPDAIAKHRHPQYEYDSGNSVPIPDGSTASDLNANFTVGYDRTSLIGYFGGPETKPRSIAYPGRIKLI